MAANWMTQQEDVAAKKANSILHQFCTASTFLDYCANSQACFIRMERNWNRLGKRQKDEELTEFWIIPREFIGKKARRSKGLFKKSEDTWHTKSISYHSRMCHVE